MIDKYEKGVFITSAVIMMVFIFSLLYSMDKKSMKLTECLPYDKTYTKGRVVKIDSGVYQVFLVAKMWSFEPAKIYIPVGSDVDFYITSMDVVHGFNIAEKNINLMAVYGAVGKTTVRFNNPGVFNIVCHEYCGIGHQNMHAEVIVNYPESK